MCIRQRCTYFDRSHQGRLARGSCSSSTFPISQILQFQNGSIVIEFLLESKVIVGVTLYEISIPGNKVTPISMIELQDVRVWNGPNFRQCDNLLIVDKCNKLLPLNTDRSMVASGRIRVVTDDIHNIVSRIPSWVNAVPNPNEIA